jgi:hypothetical protein
MRPPQGLTDQNALSAGPRIAPISQDFQLRIMLCPGTYDGHASSCLPLRLGFRAHHATVRPIRRSMETRAGTADARPHSSTAHDVTELLDSCRLGLSWLSTAPSYQTGDHYPGPLPVEAWISQADLSSAASPTRTTPYPTQSMTTFPRLRDG